MKTLTLLVVLIAGCSESPTMEAPDLLPATDGGALDGPPSAMCHLALTSPQAVELTTGVSTIFCMRPAAAGDVGVAFIVGPTQLPSLTLQAQLPGQGTFNLPDMRSFVNFEQNGDKCSAKFKGSVEATRNSDGSWRVGFGLQCGAPSFDLVGYLEGQSQP